MSQIARRQLFKGALAAAVGSAVAGSLLPPAAAAAAEPLGTPMSLDGRPAPAYDLSRASKLPREMTGYWTRSLLVGGQTRTVKVYISPETPIRSYYTVIAVPDGVATADFLWTSGWTTLADEKQEGLVVLEPGPGGWGSATQEAAYVDAAMAFYESNPYFSIFGEHYLVGYGAGAPALEAWALRRPLKVIAQVHLDSRGLPADLLAAQGPVEFDGDSAPTYTDVVLPAGFDRISHAETVLPTWYVNPDPQASAASLAYWRAANDATGAGAPDSRLGVVHRQAADSDRWMTAFAGPISQVAVLGRALPAQDIATTRAIDDFLTQYTRYENFFAYGNALHERADYEALGIQVRTMVVDGDLREFLLHVPTSARRIWGDAAPVVFVWPGNSQTAKVFLDATRWWKVAQDEGVVLVIIGEQYSSSSISVSHADSNLFFQQLRQLVLDELDVDPTRFYSSGQSAGSFATQNFAAALPEYFAAVASTSGATSPNAAGVVRIDGQDLPASGESIPNYLVYGAGDLANLAGDLWDSTSNALDAWAAYHLGASGFTLADVDDRAGLVSGWQDRLTTWTWSREVSGTQVPLVQLSLNAYRSHNTIPEETPLLWDFLEHYSSELAADGSVVRYYSPSGFTVAGDRVRITPMPGVPALQAVAALLAGYRADGTISSRTAAQLSERLDRAVQHASDGREEPAIALVEQFIARVRNQVKGDAADAAARSALVAAAETALSELRAYEAAERR